MADVKPAASNSSNYMRLWFLVHKTKDYLRKQFIQQWDLINGAKKWKDTKENRLQFIKGFGKKLYSKSDRNEKETMSMRNLADWDITLLIKSLNCLNATFLHKIVDELRLFRNKLAHLGELKIDDNQFEEYWKQISDLLLQLDISEKEIEEIRYREIKSSDKSEKEVESVPVPEPESAPGVLELKQEGNKAFQQENFEEAIRLYTKAICTSNVLKKDLAMLYSNRSAAYLKLGDISSAKQDAKTSVELDSTWFKGYYRLAMVYKAMKQYQLAVKNLLLSKDFSATPQNLEDEINFCIRLIHQPTTEDHHDPEYRKKITLAHRERFLQLLAIMTQGGLSSFLSINLTLESKEMKNLPTLKSIYLEQMNKQNKERVYKGFVLKLTLMEDPHEKLSEGTAIHTIARDDQNSYQRLAIYDYSPTRNALLTNLGYGSKISIINPYYRIAMDGSACIRVDDFGTVYIHRDLKNPKMCRYCGSENYAGKPIPCRSCKRCFYCSKKCLKDDASKLKHDLICSLAFAFDENTQYAY